MRRGPRIREALSAAGALLAGALGCADLPAIRAGECGNQVVEAGEDCDTLAPYPGALCRPKGTTGQCHFDCRRGSDGQRPPCPSGWGCDDDDLCRAPSETFAYSATHRVGGAWTLLAGDYDGDERSEVISRSRENALGQSPLRIHYFDDRGALAETRTFPKQVGAPMIASLSARASRATSGALGALRRALVFSERSIGVLLGQPDRSLVPETFSTHSVLGSRIRIVSLAPGTIDTYAALVVLATSEGSAGIHTVDGISGRLIQRGPLLASIDMLSGHPTSGQLYEAASSPCRQLIYAFRHWPCFFVADVCARADDTGAVHWRDEAFQVCVPLSPPATIDTPPRVGDVDGDGHLDVLIGDGERRAYVAYGDGKELRPAVPHQVELEEAPLGKAVVTRVHLPMPLAAGDFSGDGRADFVLPDKLVVSRAQSAASPRYAPYQPNLAARWSVATMSDLNGDGQLDVVAAAETGPGIDFFRGTGTQVLVRSTLATSEPVMALGAGDFDGDSVGDLAYVEKALSRRRDDALMIAYGARSEPPRAATQAARIPRTEQLEVHESAELISHLIIASSEDVEGNLRGLVTGLIGSPDRIPLASYQLSRGSLLPALPSSLTVGALSGTASDDVLALDSAANGAARFWFVPSLMNRRDLPFQLSCEPAPCLDPAMFGSLANARSVAANFDGGAGDETIWILPSAAGGCALARFDLDGARLREADKSGKLLNRGTILLDDSCGDPELIAVDADADGHLDLAVLTGARDASDANVQSHRKLLVLWNDGQGGFSASNLTVVASSFSAPLQAFTPLPASAGRPFSLAYVTENALLLSRAAGPRTFEPPAQLAELEQGTGIVAVDLADSGLLDLVVADAGDLSVFRVKWRVP